MYGLKFVVKMLGEGKIYDQQIIKYEYYDFL